MRKVCYNMIIDASTLGFRELNDRVRAAKTDCELRGCLGQRFIGCGLDGVSLSVCGTPGNALGAYLNGASIEVFGNAQDAVGDTMNAGRITVHGSVGDAAGYAMRGGEIFVRGDTGYRAGIHMKAYRDKLPVLVIGGTAGSFLGEYQAGGVIVVLGLDGGRLIGDFPCTGMHGGKMLLRGDCRGIEFPAQVHAAPATAADLAAVSDSLQTFCRLFGQDCASLLRSPFTAVVPNSRNPYRQMYVAN